MVVVIVFLPSKLSKETRPPTSPDRATDAFVVNALPSPLRAAALKLVVKFPVVPVMSPLM